MRIKQDDSVMMSLLDFSNRYNNSETDCATLNSLNPAELRHKMLVEAVYKDQNPATKEDFAGLCRRYLDCYKFWPRITVLTSSLLWVAEAQQYCDAC